MLIDADRKLPAIAGDPPDVVARRLVQQYQSGAVDRTALGDAFSAHLTPERLREAAPRLAALGEPTGIRLVHRGERGGMEVAALHLTFAGSTARAALYRTPDGKVQQFLLRRD